MRNKRETETHVEGERLLTNQPYSAVSYIHLQNWSSPKVPDYVHRIILPTPELVLQDSIDHREVLRFSPPGNFPQCSQFSSPFPFMFYAYIKRSETVTSNLKFPSN